MTRILRSFIAAAFALAALAPPAFAATSVATSIQVWCSGPGAARGPRQVTNPSTGGGTYQLDQNGCAKMVPADWAYFATQGFTQGAGVGAIYVGPFTAQTTSTNSPTLPANAFIEAIIVQETTGNALTGGLDVGVAGSSDATILSALAVGANAVTSAAGTTILKHVFPTSGTTGPAAQQIYFNAHTSWNSGSINVTILYRYF